MMTGLLWNQQAYYMQLPAAALEKGVHFLKTLGSRIHVRDPEEAFVAI